MQFIDVNSLRHDESVIYLSGIRIHLLYLISQWSPNLW